MPTQGGFEKLPSQGASSCVFKVLEKFTYDAGLQAEDAVCIKPGVGSGSAGVCRLHDAQDLLIYSLALKQRAESIPQLNLSWGNAEIAMPKQYPSHFYLEPFILADG